MRVTFIFFFLSLCFSSGFKIGLDINSEVEFSQSYSNMKYDVKRPLSIGYDFLKPGTKGGFGIEYLIESEMKGIPADYSLLSLYALMNLANQNGALVFGKLGYSIPTFEMSSLGGGYYGSSGPEYESVGGIMYGIQVSYQNFLISWTMHSGEIDPVMSSSNSNDYYNYYDYYQSNDSNTLDLEHSRLTISYIF